MEPNTTATGAIDFIKQAFKEKGLLDAILSDNGSQFAGFRDGITKLERYLMDLDILPIHGRVMHPQTQGKIERFHRTDDGGAAAGADGGSEGRTEADGGVADAV